MKSIRACQEKKIAQHSPLQKGNLTHYLMAFVTFWVAQVDSNVFPGQVYLVHFSDVRTNFIVPICQYWSPLLPLSYASYYMDSYAHSNHVP